VFAQALLGVALIQILLPGTAVARTGAACADSVTSLLSRYVGRWTVRTVFLHPDGSSERQAGEAVIEPDLDGCVLVEHLRTRRDSLPFDVLAVWGAQGSPAGFQRLMSHSQHGLLGLYEGPRVGDTLFLGYAGALPDAAARLRHVVRRYGPDRFIFESQRAEGPDTSWRVTWRAEYQRRHPRGGRP
jgi:hypothetical protein